MAIKSDDHSNNGRPLLLLHWGMIQMGVPSHNTGSHAQRGPTRHVTRKRLTITNLPLFLLLSRGPEGTKEPLLGNKYKSTLEHLQSFENQTRFFFG